MPQAPFDLGQVIAAALGPDGALAVLVIAIALVLVGGFRGWYVWGFLYRQQEARAIAAETREAGLTAAIREQTASHAAALDRLSDDIRDLRRGVA